MNEYLLGILGLTFLAWFVAVEFLPFVGWVISLVCPQLGYNRTGWTAFALIFSGVFIVAGWSAYAGSVHRSAVAKNRQANVVVDAFPAP
jgi:hypothetical protein